MATKDLALHELNVAVVVREAEERLGAILGDSGTILYSSCATLKQGKYYFLGLNPGGTNNGTNSIRRSLEELALGKSTKNAYLDENWSSTSRKFPDGGHPLQRNYQFLFKQLQVELESVCASNLIFRRSISQNGARFEELAERCWQVHEAILKIVRPDTIITFGRQPFDFIKRQRFGDDRQDRPAGHGKWTWRSSTLSTGQKLVGLPHLSRYALTNHPDVVKEIRQFVGLGPLG